MMPQTSARVVAAALMARMVVDCHYKYVIPFHETLDVLELSVFRNRKMNQKDQLTFYVGCCTCAC